MPIQIGLGRHEFEAAQLANAFFDGLEQFGAFLPSGGARVKDRRGLIRWSAKNHHALNCSGKCQFRSIHERTFTTSFWRMQVIFSPSSEPVEVV